MHTIDAHRILGCQPVGDFFSDEDALLADMDAASIDEAYVTRAWQLFLDPRDGCFFDGRAGFSSPRLTEMPAFQAGHPSLSMDDIAALVQVSRMVRCTAWPGQDPMGQETDGVWRRLSDTQVAVAIDVGAFGWKSLERLASEFPKLKILVLSTGYRALARILSIARTTTSVWFETGTLISAGSIEWLAREIGAHRLVFGTGAPQRDSGGATSLLQHADFSDEDRQRIAAENLLDLVARS